MEGTTISLTQIQHRGHTSDAEAIRGQPHKYWPQGSATPVLLPNGGTPAEEFLWSSSTSSSQSRQNAMVWFSRQRLLLSGAEKFTLNRSIICWTCSFSWPPTNTGLRTSGSFWRAPAPRLQSPSISLSEYKVFYSLLKWQQVL